VFQSSQLLICNDSGVSHIAAGVKTKSVVIFSPYSNPSEWAPLDKTFHVPLSAEKVTPDSVITTALHLLKPLRYSTQFYE
jgi:ADP-heptose:LPS heptosyltransferase